VFVPILVGAFIPHNSSAVLDAAVTVSLIIVVPLAILLLTYLVSRLASRRLRGGLERAGFQSNIAILLSRTLWIAVWVTGFLAELRFIGLGLEPLAAFIGVVGLAASLSLQAVLQNLVAGVYLLAERPFHIGDIVSVIGPGGLNHEGTVEDIQMRTTHLRSRDSELILVPNALMFSGVITNRTAVGGYPTEISLTFPRTHDPDKIRVELTDALSGVAAVLREPAPRLRVDKIATTTWTGGVVFWVSATESRSDAIWRVGSTFPEATVNDGEAAVGKP
jgi:small conductance mechanosensitive channel